MVITFSLILAPWKRERWILLFSADAEEIVVFSGDRPTHTDIHLSADDDELSINFCRLLFLGPLFSGADGTGILFSSAFLSDISYFSCL